MVDPAKLRELLKEAATQLFLNGDGVLADVVNAAAARIESADARIAELTEAAEERALLLANRVNELADARDQLTAAEATIEEKQREASDDCADLMLRLAAAEAARQEATVLLDIGHREIAQLREILDNERSARVEAERRLGVELQRPKVRPGHHPPCRAMYDSEAVCTCGQ